MLGQPQRPVDVRIQRAAGVAHGLACEIEAQPGAVFFRLWPAIHAEQMPGFEFPGGFFQHFAFYRIDERFIVFQVSGGLVDDGQAAYGFFHHEEFAVFFNDGGDSDVRKKHGTDTHYSVKKDDSAPVRREKKARHKHLIFYPVPPELQEGSQSYYRQ